MLDAHPCSAATMLCDLELFVSLFTSIFLFTFANPVRNLTLSPDTLFDKSCYHSQHFFHYMISSGGLAHSSMANLHKTSPGDANMHSLLVVPGAWLLERELCSSLATVVPVSVLANRQVQEEVSGCLTASKVSASHPPQDEDSRLDFVVCTTST